jgi:quercetin dioxygenase-like cupin family protein
MKPLSVRVAPVALSFLLFSASLAQTTSPRQEKLVFENQFVKAYEVTIKPGESLPPHESGNRIIYSLTQYTLRYKWDGRTSEEKRKAGDVHFHPAGRHNEENGGSNTVKFILLERLEAPLPPAEGTGIDMAKANPHNTKVLFDRDMAKVFEVTLYPKDAISMHFGLDRLIYSINAGTLTVTGADGKTTDVSFKAGGYRWEPAGLHAAANGGKSAVKLVVFSFKK